MGSITEGTPISPKPRLSKEANGITLLRPLSRRGHGPGVITLVHEDEQTKVAGHDPTIIYGGVPSPTMKWAEEGYAVIEIREVAFQDSQDPFVAALHALSRCDVCDAGKVGVIAYSPSLWNAAAPLLAAHSEIAASIIYSDTSSTLTPSSVPSVQHIAGAPTSKDPLPRTPQVTGYSYPSSPTFAFATPLTTNFHYANDSVSHTRNLTFLKPHLGGPFFDLEAIWDEHTYYEFSTRSVPDTMSTMVEEPYVNHIPTITGGIGRERLTDFYANHFVHANPPDTELELISRTVGIDRVIDEFIFCFTHTVEIPWLIPGIPPTGRKAQIPFTAVVNIRGDRLYHEHISWDQATLLRQLGLLPEYLPLPEDVKVEGKQGRLEFRVPAAGMETAMKMRDKNCVASNEMFDFGVREVK